MKNICSGWLGSEMAVKECLLEDKRQVLVSVGSKEHKWRWKKNSKSLQFLLWNGKKVVIAAEKDKNQITVICYWTEELVITALTELETVKYTKSQKFSHALVPTALGMLAVFGQKMGKPVGDTQVAHSHENREPIERKCLCTIFLLAGHRLRQNYYNATMVLLFSESGRYFMYCKKRIIIWVWKSFQRVTRWNINFSFWNWFFEMCWSGPDKTNCVLCVKMCHLVLNATVQIKTSDLRLPFSPLRDPHPLSAIKPVNGNVFIHQHWWMLVDFEQSDDYYSSLQWCFNDISNSGLCLTKKFLKEDQW